MQIPVRYLPVVIVLTASSSLLVLAQVKTDREQAGLVGPVKTVRTRSAEFQGEKVVGEGYRRSDLWESVTYDTSGNEISEDAVSDFGENLGRITHVYNEAGSMIEARWTDKSGTLLKRDVYNNISGKPLEQLTYDGSGKLVGKTIKAYDLSGRLISETYFDPDKAAAMTVYRYADKAIPAEVAFFMADGTKAIAPVGPCLGAHRITYDYDQNGRLVKEEVFEPEGTRKKSYRWSYDTRGNIGEYFSETDGSTVSIVYKYELDSKGNWTKRFAVSTSLEKGLTVFGKPATPYVRTTVTTREINYY